MTRLCQLPLSCICFCLPNNFTIVLYLLLFTKSERNVSHVYFQRSWKPKTAHLFLWNYGYIFLFLFPVPFHIRQLGSRRWWCWPASLRRWRWWRYVHNADVEMVPFLIFLTLGSTRSKGTLQMVIRFLFLQMYVTVCYHVLLLVTMYVLNANI